MTVGSHYIRGLYCKQQRQHVDKHYFDNVFSTSLRATPVPQEMRDGCLHDLPSISRILCRFCPPQVVQNRASSRVPRRRIVLPRSGHSILLSPVADKISDSHLSSPAIAHGVKRHFSTKGGDTALHGGKDLAVALPMLPPELTISNDRVARAFRHAPSLFAPRGLLRAGVTRYLSPCRMT